MTHFTGEHLPDCTGVAYAIDLQQQTEWKQTARRREHTSFTDSEDGCIGFLRNVEGIRTLCSKFCGRDRASAARPPGWGAGKQQQHRSRGILPAWHWGRCQSYPAQETSPHWTQMERLFSSAAITAVSAVPEHYSRRLSSACTLALPSILQHFTRASPNRFLPLPPISPS
jgi:hypothetical protein